MSEFLNAILAGLLGSGIATALLGAVLLRRSAQIEHEVRALFDERLQRAESNREYKEASLEQLFGPMKMQLCRTRRVFKRWTKRSDHIEKNIIRESNLRMRDLLLEKGQLIPANLMERAEELIEHFDVWLEEYEKLQSQGSNRDAPFAFAGPQGFPFPKEAEQEFIAHANRLQTELYTPGLAHTDPVPGMAIKAPG